MKAVLKVDTSLTLTIYANNQLLSAEEIEIGPGSIDRVFASLSGHPIEDLVVYVRPTPIKGIPGKGTYVLSTLGDKDDIYIGISQSDLQTLKVMSKGLSLELIRIVTSFDLIASIYSEDSLIVVDEYFEGDVILVVVKEGSIVDFEICKPPVLDTVIKALMLDSGLDKVVRFKEGLFSMEFYSARNSSSLDEDQFEVLADSFLALSIPSGAIIDLSGTYSPESVQHFDEAPVSSAETEIIDDFDLEIKDFRDRIKPVDLDIELDILPTPNEAPQAIVSETPKKRVPKVPASTKTPKPSFKSKRPPKKEESLPLPEEEDTTLEPILKEEPFTTVSSEDNIAGSPAPPKKGSRGKLPRKGKKLESESSEPNLPSRAQPKFKSLKPKSPKFKQKVEEDDVVESPAPSFKVPKFKGSGSSQPNKVVSYLTLAFILVIVGSFIFGASRVPKFSDESASLPEDYIKQLTANVANLQKVSDTGEGYYLSTHKLVQNLATGVSVTNLEFRSGVVYLTISAKSLNSFDKFRQTLDSSFSIVSVDDVPLVKGDSAGSIRKQITMK